MSNEPNNSSGDIDNARRQVPVLIASNRQREKRRRILATVDAGSSDSIRIGLNRKVHAAAAQLGAQLEAQVHAVYVVPVSVVALRPD